jgi:hypothetical protein
VTQLIPLSIGVVFGVLGLWILLSQFPITQTTRTDQNFNRRIRFLVWRGKILLVFGGLNLLISDAFQSNRVPLLLIGVLIAFFGQYLRMIDYQKHHDAAEPEVSALQELELKKNAQFRDGLGLGLIVAGLVLFLLHVGIILLL